MGRDLRLGPGGMAMVASRVRHGEKTPRAAVAIPQLEGLPCPRTIPIPTKSHTGVSSLGIRKEYRYGPSLSPSHNSSRVSGAGHGGRKLPHGFPIPYL